MAETLGVVPNEELFIVYNAKSGLIWNENYYGQALVPIHLPPSYLMPLQVTRSPRPSPSVFAYCKQSNTGGRNGLGMKLHTHGEILMYCYCLPARCAPDAIDSRYIRNVFKGCCGVQSTYKTHYSLR